MRQECTISSTRLSHITVSDDVPRDDSVSAISSTVMQAQSMQSFKVMCISASVCQDVLKHLKCVESEYSMALYCYRSSIGYKSSMLYQSHMLWNDAMEYDVCVKDESALSADMASTCMTVDMCNTLPVTPMRQKKSIKLKAYTIRTANRCIPYIHLKMLESFKDRCNVHMHLICSHVHYGHYDSTGIESDVSAYISMALPQDNLTIIDRSLMECIL